VRPAAFHSAASPSIALSARLASKAMNATIISLYYLAIFAAHSIAQRHLEAKSR
jgi:hypothetical protein